MGDTHGTHRGTRGMWDTQGTRGCTCGRCVGCMGHTRDTRGMWGARRTHRGCGDTQRTFMGYIWGMCVMREHTLETRWTCQGCTWGVNGDTRDAGTHKQGTWCWGHMWGHTWDLHRTYQRHTWDVEGTQETHRGHAWNTEGTCGRHRTLAGHRECTHGTLEHAGLKQGRGHRRHGGHNTAQARRGQAVT